METSFINGAGGCFGVGCGIGSMLRVLIELFGFLIGLLDNEYDAGRSSKSPKFCVTIRFFLNLGAKSLLDSTKD